MKKLAFVLLTLACSQVTAQITIESALTQTPKDGEILIADQTIVYTKGQSVDPIIGPMDIVPPHELALDLPRDEEGRYVIEAKTRFVSCSFPPDFILSDFNFQDSLIFSDCTFKSHTIFRNLKCHTIYFDFNTHELLIIKGSTFGKFISYGDEIDMLVEIDNSHFQSIFIDVDASDLFMTNNVINIPKPTITVSDSSLFYEVQPTNNSIEVLKATEIYFRGNTFNGHGPYDIVSCAFPDGEDISINNNTIQGLFRLTGKSQFLTMTGNEIDYFDSREFSFPGFNASVHWNDLAGHRLANLYWHSLEDGMLNRAELEDYYDQMNFLGEEWVPQFYFGSSSRELLSKRHFDNLLANYYRIYTIFKVQGRVDDANAVYVEMKELEGRRLKALYKKDRTLKNFLKSKLHQLLKLYTEHGTQPIKAIVISFYLLIFFSLFYFFFPSEWDEFELDRKQWKEQGFKKASFVAVKHMLNSVVLSLNAFVTLGFGNIPTTGVPRYICVIQGFIGWFLLSLFTVALINQTLF